MLGVVIGSSSVSSVTFTKMMGTGMIVAPIVDVTVVRLLVVPATMKLLGKANWWEAPFDASTRASGSRNKLRHSRRGALQSPPPPEELLRRGRRIATLISGLSRRSGVRVREV